MEARDLRTVVADNIRRHAEQRGLPLYVLADHAGVSRTQLYDVLSATKAPTTDWLARIAVVLEVEPWVLLKPGPKQPDR